MHREMLGLQLERLQLIDGQIEKLNGLIAQAMKPSAAAESDGMPAGRNADQAVDCG